MTRYVLGFAISSKNEAVLLIEKQKPDWQKGFLNGIGGKIEPDELPIDAMVREFEEETGIKTDMSRWSEFCIMKGEGWECNCFKAFTDEIFWAKQTTDEAPMAIDISDFEQYRILPNVPWLVRMAMDNDSFKAVINY